MYHYFPRLFNVLLYASVTTRFAPLKTPSGLQRLVKSGHLTADEREALLQSSLVRERVDARTREGLHARLAGA
jgi:hypothetical protein